MVNRVESSLTKSPIRRSCQTMLVCATIAVEQAANGRCHCSGIAAYT